MGCMSRVELVLLGFAVSFLFLLAFVFAWRGSHILPYVELFSIYIRLLTLFLFLIKKKYGGNTVPCFSDFCICFVFTLQILSSVLEQIPFHFSIRLAALASQKEYASLDKWLNDCLRTHKDVFFEVGFVIYFSKYSTWQCQSSSLFFRFNEMCVKIFMILIMLLPGVSQVFEGDNLWCSRWCLCQFISTFWCWNEYKWGDKFNLLEGFSDFLSSFISFPCSILFSATSQLVTHILQVLQANTDQIASKQLSEELKSLHRASMHVSPRLQNVGASDSSTSDVYTNDIEAEANSYFHQIFSGQLTIDSMIQMLARFKESSDRRFVVCLITMAVWASYHTAYL